MDSGETAKWCITIMLVVLCTIYLFPMLLEAHGNREIAKYLFCKGYWKNYNCSDVRMGFEEARGGGLFSSPTERLMCGCKFDNGTFGESIEVVGYG